MPCVIHGLLLTVVTYHCQLPGKIILPGSIRLPSTSGIPGSLGVNCLGVAAAHGDLSVDRVKRCEKWINTYENTIFRGMNIHKSQLF